MMEPVLEVLQLTKKFGETHALRGINFSVNPGEIFGFIGPNGAGKTTTIRILTGQITANTGVARIFGQNVETDQATILPKVGFVPEQTNLYERLTVRQNLQLFCRLYGCPFGIIEDYLTQVDLLDVKDKPVKKLSKGMKQRVLLIRALLHQPKLLFLDEPTSGLDPVSAKAIHQILLNLHRNGTTILLTSHNMEEVEKLCGRVAFIHRGDIKEIGKPSTLKRRYSTDQVRIELAAEGGIQEQIISLNGRESARLLAQWMEAGMVRAIHSQEPTLADIFVAVTGGELI